MAAPASDDMAGERMGLQFAATGTLPTAERSLEGDVMMCKVTHKVGLLFDGDDVQGDFKTGTLQRGLLFDNACFDGVDV